MRNMQIRSGTVREEANARNTAQAARSARSPRKSWVSRMLVNDTVVATSQKSRPCRVRELTSWQRSSGNPRTR